jgi:CheY-like chemotaxis protein
VEDVLQGGGPILVLVVDDEFAVLEVLAMALEGDGYRVLRANDGAEALRVLEREVCDVVITDDAMAVMGGRELVACMRCDLRFSKIPVILLADGPNVPGVDVAATLLPKPIRLRELLERVREASSSRRSA